MRHRRRATGTPPPAAARPRTAPTSTAASDGWRATTTATYAASTANRSTMQHARRRSMPSWRVTNDRRGLRQVRHRRAERREGDEPLARGRRDSAWIVAASRRSRSPVGVHALQLEVVQEVLAARPLHLQDHVEREARAAEPGARLLLGHEACRWRSGTSGRSAPARRCRRSAAPRTRGTRRRRSASTRNVAQRVAEHTRARRAAPRRAGVGATVGRRPSCAARG